MRRLSRPFAAMIFLAAAGCASQDITPPTIEATTFATSLGVDLAASTKTASGVYYRDITVGTGATVVSGQHLTVRYTGWLANGTEFENNVNGPPLSFQVGVHQVIDGWDDGIPGMKVGGRRQLIIPSTLAYGLNGSPPDIPPNAILVFIVDVLTAQ